MDNDSMFARCANPDCGAPFHYRQGQLFRFLQRDPLTQALTSTHSVRHLWLCKTCSELYTLVYRPGLGVVFDRRFQPLADKQEPRLIAAA